MTCSCKVCCSPLGCDEWLREHEGMRCSNADMSHSLWKIWSECSECITICSMSEVFTRIGDSLCLIRWILLVCDGLEVVWVVDLPIAYWICKFDVLKGWLAWEWVDVDHVGLVHFGWWIWVDFVMHSDSGATKSGWRQQRPYQLDSTASRPLSEVKQARARLVLRWGTTLESLVLLFCFPHFCFPQNRPSTHTHLLALPPPSNTLIKRHAQSFSVSTQQSASYTLYHYSYTHNQYIALQNWLHIIP